MADKLKQIPKKLLDWWKPEAEDNSCLCAGRCDPDGFYCGICSDKTAIYTGCKL